MTRHRLTDEQWALIADLFPPPKHTGRPRRDPREMVEASLHVLNTGEPWRDLPAEFGPWATAWYWFNRWAGDGTWDAILRRLQQHVGVDDALWCVDGTSVRAHKCAAGGGKRGSLASRPTMRSGAAVAVSPANST